MAEPVAHAAVAENPDDVVTTTTEAASAGSADPGYRNGLRPVPLGAEVLADAAATDPASRAERAGAPGDPAELRRRIDALSLSQALLDFEVANARVLDLTARLVDVGRQVVDMQAANDALRDELAHSKAEIQRLEKRYRKLVASTSYRWANRLWTLRKAITGK